jgi:hypothetical protein
MKQCIPTSITINKALSRISSINELKIMKDQLTLQRKSVNNSSVISAG